ncbi:MAG: hypothetical protein HYY18_11745 [Planctomycetes bacterium]|nr:hypothetical protein [Planctomycetota bacterium]
MAERDAFDIVKDLLEAKRAGQLDLQILRDARSAIEEVVRRIERVKAMSPAFASVGFGDEVYELVASLGEKKKPLRFPLLSRVAALL